MRCVVIAGEMFRNSCLSSLCLEEEVVSVDGTSVFVETVFRSLLCVVYCIVYRVSCE